MSSVSPSTSHVSATTSLILGADGVDSGGLVSGADEPDSQLWNDRRNAGLRGAMAVTVEALRALGNRRVTLRTMEGSFDGRVAQDRLSDHAVVILFAREGDAGEPLVVPLDSVESVVER